MFVPSFRSSPKASIPRRLLDRAASQRRSISFRTPPAQRPRSWRNSAARWGLALGGLYYLNTSNIISEQASFLRSRLPEALQTSAKLETLDSVIADRCERQHARAQLPTLDTSSPSTTPELSSAASAATLQSSAPSQGSPTPVTADPGDPQELEDEADDQGAFNPATGEINWDCPCLGGMAHGPCGAQFREAFSCFVHSHEEPKGINCIERFKDMQDCFRAHPDIYAAELSDDPDSDALGAPIEDEPGPLSSTPDQTPTPTQPDAASARGSGESTPQGNVPGSDLTSTPSAAPTSLSSSTKIPSEVKAETDAKDSTRRERAKKAIRQVEKDHGDEAARRTDETMVPKAWHDATEKNEGAKS